MGKRHNKDKFAPWGHGDAAMKITISYTASEEQEAAGVLAALRPLLPGLRVHKTEGKPPFLHLYLTTKKPKTVEIPSQTLDRYPLYVV